MRGDLLAEVLLSTRLLLLISNTAEATRSFYTRNSKKELSKVGKDSR